MPLYDYKCASCGHIHEVRHGFNESYEGKCPVCGGELRRVFNPAPIVFKGSGFYVTDSRTASSDKRSSSSTSGGDSGKAAEKSGSSETSGKGPKDSAA